MVRSLGAVAGMMGVTATKFQPEKANQDGDQCDGLFKKCRSGLKQDFSILDEV
jgi:hypothetical protein